MNVRHEIIKIYWFLKPFGLGCTFWSKTCPNRGGPEVSFPAANQRNLENHIKFHLFQKADPRLPLQKAWDHQNFQNW